VTTIPLTSALRLLRQFGDNPDTVAVIEKAIAELDRLYKIEAAMIELEATKQQEQGEADWLEAQVIARPG
jgi:hypothetical protein